MNSISIDIETYSSVDLKKCGVYKYAESEDFEILLFAYSVDNQDVVVLDLASGDVIPKEIIRALTDKSVIKWAFNAQFERVCLSKYLNKWLNPESWQCTMVWSATLGLPLSLEGVGAVLGLEKQKLTEGKSLITYFCKPCTATKTNGGRTRNSPHHDKEKWHKFKEYNKRDVEVELQIQQKLSKFPVSHEIWEEYHISETINDRGIAVDMQFVESAIILDKLTKDTLMEKLKTLTNLENPNSVMQMKSWLLENGLEIESLNKNDVAEVLKTAPAMLADVLTLRGQLSKSSVKKYTAMQNAVCKDNRVRGMFQFYGANRTGRFSGRIVQLQNLPRNYIFDLEQARELVKHKNFDAINMLYDNFSEILSELIRTSFIPQNNRKFIVSDFSTIEARVIAWLAGEKWRLDAFARGEDIYCASASKMFGVTVVKGGENGELRQKGKQAELACIAENSLVLTNVGLVPIQEIKLHHKLWDGESWIEHEGLVYQGEKEVITYDGLTATKDHLVWVEGKSEPIYFGVASTSGTYLIQTGDGRRAIRLGENYQSGKKVEQENESLLCTSRMYRLWSNKMDITEQSNKRNFKRMSKLFSTKTNSTVVRPQTDSCKTKMRKSKRQRLHQLWCKRDNFRFQKCNRGGVIPYSRIWATDKKYGNRQNRYKWKLCSRKFAICNPYRKLCKSKKKCTITIRAEILALLSKCGCKEIVSRFEQKRSNRSGGTCCVREKKKLETNSSKIRVYDIRNAGKHNRFTVSGKLVHNCGYQGSVGALKAMGAIEMGLAEEELKPLVDSWRSANSKIVQLWYAVDKAVIDCIKMRCTTKTHGIIFSYKSGFLFITLPSGRKLAYVKPRIGENQFGGDSVTHEGVGATKKWERLESYGGKFVENIVQAISRDILMYAIENLKDYNIVAHVHDEIIIETSTETSLETVCKEMSKTPPWANDLLLNADGFECKFYKKD